MPKFVFEVDLHREYTMEADCEEQALEDLDAEVSCINPFEDHGYTVVGTVVDGVRTKPNP